MDFREPSTFALQQMDVMGHLLLHPEPCQFNIQMITATPGGGSGNYTYSWNVSTPGASALFVPGATTNNFIWLTSHSLVPGTYDYTLTVTDAGTGCQKIKNYSLIILQISIQHGYCIHHQHVFMKPE